MRKTLWSPGEDEMLKNCVEKYGTRNWKEIANRTGLGRCPKSCRLRWFNYLRPELKRCPFSPLEAALLLHLHASYGNRWSKIASHLPGRSDNDVKNFWHTFSRRSWRAQFNDNNVTNNNNRGSSINISSTSISNIITSTSDSMISGSYFTDQHLIGSAASGTIYSMSTNASDPQQYNHCLITSNSNNMGSINCDDHVNVLYSELYAADPEQLDDHQPNTRSATTTSNHHQATNSSTNADIISKDQHQYNSITAPNSSNFTSVISNIVAPSCKAAGGTMISLISTSSSSSSISTPSNSTRQCDTADQISCMLLHRKQDHGLDQADVKSMSMQMPAPDHLEYMRSMIYSTQHLHDDPTYNYYQYSGSELEEDEDDYEDEEEEEEEEEENNMDEHELDHPSDDLIRQNASELYRDYIPSCVNQGKHADLIVISNCIEPVRISSRPSISRIISTGCNIPAAASNSTTSSNIPSSDPDVVNMITGGTKPPEGLDLIVWKLLNPNLPIPSSWRES